MCVKERWINEYIDNIDISKVEWIKLDRTELMKFYDDNYLDSDTWKYVSDEDNNSCFCTPLGFRYLTFDYNNDNYSFFIGIVRNNIGKKTIVSVMVYLDNYYLFAEQKEPLTYISFVEVNSYFWNKGLYTKMCEMAINYVNPNQHIITSDESDMGRKYEVFRKLKKIFVNNGFENYIWMNDQFYNLMTEVYNVVCSRKKVLEKIN